MRASLRVPEKMFSLELRKKADGFVIIAPLMRKTGKEGFYYHAAAYTDIELAGEVYHALNKVLHAADYNLSVFRTQEPETHVYIVVVIGERPSQTVDQIIVEHLMRTGEMVELPPDVLQMLLARRPDMN
jgi:hypothetical protein